MRPISEQAVSHYYLLPPERHLSNALGNCILDFIASLPLTVGLKFEFQLLDKASLDLTDGIQPLIERYQDSPYVKSKIIQNTVEITTRTGDDVSQIHQHLIDITKDVKRNCFKLGMNMCAAGTHPFCTKLARVTPTPGYLQMEKTGDHHGHTDVTFATHVHIGVENTEDALHLMNAFRPYLPLLIALSANSPFWHGYDSGFASYRQRLLSTSRSYGIPPRLHDWQQFTDLLGASLDAGIINSITNLPWDIRPRPHLGTVEVRIMDAQSSISEAMQLASFIRVLAAYLLEHRDAGPGDLPHALPWWNEKDNCYLASQLGLKANYFVNKKGAFRPLLDIWQDVRTELCAYAEKFGESMYYHQLVDRVAQQNTGYGRQRRIYKETNSLEKVVLALIQELENDLASRR